MNTILENLLIIGLILGVFHFVYQNLILPTLRNSLIFELDKLNDEAINLVINDKSSVKANEFNITTFFIHETAKRLTTFNLFSLLFRRKSKIKEEEKFDFVEFENEISNKRLKKIFEESLNISFKAHIINSFGLIFYILPLILLVILVSKMFGVQKFIKDFFINNFNNRITKDKLPANDNGMYCPV